jgi:hypothetical protein
VSIGYTLSTFEKPIFVRYQTGYWLIFWMNSHSLSFIQFMIAIFDKVLLPTRRAIYFQIINKFKLSNYVSKLYKYINEMVYEFEMKLPLTRNLLGI